jgi:flagellar hook-associated protein 3 FlgL
MRVSTANSYDNTVTNLQQRQIDLSNKQNQMTSGLRVNLPSDDPVAAARAERAQATISRSEADKRTAEAAKNAMTLSESALGSATDLLQSARETLVQAGNGSYTDAERQALAAKLKEIRKQLFQVANSPDGNGGFLFGGQGSAAPPFVDAAGGVQFVGQGGQNLSDAGDIVPTTIDGGATWLHARSGNGVFVTSSSVQNGSGWINAGSVSNPSQITGHNYDIQFSVSGSTTTYNIVDTTLGSTVVSNATYAPGTAIQADGMSFTISGTPANGDTFQIQPSTNSLSVFDAMDKTIAALNTPGLNGGQVAQTINQGLRDIDSVTSTMGSARAAAGETLNRIDGVENRIDSQSLAAKTAKSDAVDLDMVSAISDFQTQQASYDAALKTYSLVQKMSLFQYISG